jgi:exodeoxyribonuclease VII small subunit
MAKAGARAAAETDQGQGTGSTLGYEQARDELIDVVRRLEAGGATLEESLALWERGEELAKVCRHWLEGARARLDAALAAEDDASAAGDTTDDDNPSAH